MQRFQARLIKSGSFGAEAMTLPPDLLIAPQTWSASDRGGMKQATLSASGSAESLAYLLTWLGDRIEIYNEMGDCVWYGTLWDIEASLGNVRVNVSMDNVFNRIAVIYPYQLTDGTEESRTTDWTEDADSILRYGTRELLYGMPAAFGLSADTVRDQLLPRFAFPAPIISTEASNEYAATLTAMGNWYKTDSVYYQNTEGLEEHMESSGVQVIGRYITSTGISFAGLTPSGQPDGPDDMHDTNSSFGDLTNGDIFTISGANIPADPDDPQNNGTFTVGDHTSATLETEEASFVDEAAGNTIKISWGDGVSMDNIAMSFQIDTAWEVTHIAVLCRQVGNVSDNFRIGLYPDNAGVPGVVLAANETLGTALSTELTWTEFELDVPTTLVANTPYWIGIRRTGAANLANGYEVAVDEGLGYANGAAKVWDGSNWWPRQPDSDMPFRVIGEINSTAQMENALEASGVFLYNLIQLDSEIPIRQYMDTPQTALSVIEEMLDAGTSSGYRLISWITQDNAAIVNVPELSSEQNLVLGKDGKLRYPTGGLYPPGKLIHGQYIDVDGLLLLDGISIRANRGPSVYVQESSYDANADMVSIQSEGALDPWAALSVRKG